MSDHPPTTDAEANSYTTTRNDDSSSSHSSFENDIEPPPIDAMTAYGHPHKPEVIYDKFCLYRPYQLTATRMYNKQFCQPIALLCMSI